MPKGIPYTGDLCSKCNKNPTNKTIGYGGGNLTWCKECNAEKNRNAYAKKTVEERREIGLKRRYGITYADYMSMYDTQNGNCRICNESLVLWCDKREPKAACVDHCHATGKIRGLLCHECNVALGLVHENEVIAQNMIRYIKENRIG
jgi:hypothetical protein